MAVGQFVDYSAGPQPGSFEFKRADGSNMLAYGPQAQQLAAMLERQKAASPQPVAQNGGFGGQVNNDWATDAPAPNPSVQTREAPPPSIARPPEQQAPQAPPAQPIAVARTASGGTIYRDPTTGQLAEMRPGSPGVSREQLQRRAGSGVETPVSASQTVQGGYDRNADYEASLADATIDQKLALDSLREARTAAADSERQFHAAQAASAAKQLQAEQQRVAETQAQHARDMDSLNQAQSDVKAAKVDPNRIFSGAGGTLRAIGSAIAAGLGAFGAGLARTQNFALDIIQRSIDRDIAAQESDLAKAERGQDTALRRWMATGASLEQAKSAVKIQQLAYAEQKMGEIAAKNKSAEVQGAYQAQSAELSKALATELENYRVRSLGQRTAEVASRYAYPQGGTRGGVVPITLSDASTLANIQKTEREGAKAGAPTEGAAKAASLYGQLQVMGKRLQGRDPNQQAFSGEGQNIVTRGVRGAVNAVAGEGTMLPGNQQQRNESQEFEQVKNDLMAQTSVANGQGAMAEPDAKRVQAGISASRTWGELQRAHQYMLEKAAQHAQGFGVNITAPPSQEDLGLKKRGVR